MGSLKGFLGAFYEDGKILFFDIIMLRENCGLGRRSHPFLPSTNYSVRIQPINYDRINIFKYEHFFCPII